MDEVVKNINNKVFLNPIYFIFGISWVLVHWRFFVVMFLISNNDIVLEYKITKDVYLKTILFDMNYWYCSILVILIPFFVTWLVIYHIQPKLFPPLLRKHKKYEDEKLSIEKGIEEKKKEVLNLTEDNVKKQKEIEKLAPESLWLRDFLEFTKHFLYKDFNYIIQSIYEYNGNVSVEDTRYYGAQDLFRIPKEILAYCHTTNLINFDNNKSKIELTEKGKFFVKEYSGEKGLLH